MRLDGHDVISRQTLVAWRLVTTLSATLIAVGYFDYNADPWPVFAREVSQDDFAVIASVALAFVTLTHLVNWSNDYLAYTTWFSKNDANVASVFASSMPVTTEPTLAAVKKHIDHAIRSLNEGAAKLSAIDVNDFNANLSEEDAARVIRNFEENLKGSSQTLAGMTSTLQNVDAWVQELKPNFTKVSRRSKRLLYAWYLALPLGLVVLAFWFLQ